MSNRGGIGPFHVFPRVLGSNDTMAGFMSRVGLQQSLTGDDGTINLNVYHTKIYSTNKKLTLKMGTGRQEGQTKLITFTFKGNENATIEVNCPSLIAEYSRIVFENVGDQAQLTWIGSAWVPLVTLNVSNPSLNTPVIS